jgi:hypothetical protein
MFFNHLHQEQGEGNMSQLAQKEWLGLYGQIGACSTLLFPYLDADLVTGYLGEERVQTQLMQNAPSGAAQGLRSHVQALDVRAQHRLI